MPLDNILFQNPARVLWARNCGWDGSAVSLLRAQFVAPCQCVPDVPGVLITDPTQHCKGDNMLLSIWSSATSLPQSLPPSTTVTELREENFSKRQASGGVTSSCGRRGGGYNHRLITNSLRTLSTALVTPIFGIKSTALQIIIRNALNCGFKAVSWSFLCYSRQIPSSRSELR